MSNTLIRHDDELDADVAIDPADAFETRHALYATRLEAVEAEGALDVIDALTFKAGLGAMAAQSARRRIAEAITTQAPDGRYYVTDGRDEARLRDPGADGGNLYDLIPRADVERIIAEAGQA